MSQLAITSEVGAVAGEIRRMQVIDVVRAATFIGVVLLVWMSLRPFEDLSNAEIGGTSTGNEAPTYALFGALALLSMTLAMRENIQGLKTLVTPAFVLFAGWLCFTILLSFDPSTSIKRFSLTGCVMAVTAALPLLAKSQHELMRWISIAALVLLTTCYLGIVLVPHLSIHLATDPQEPGLAGNWRGVFAHKNVAAAIMVMLVFYGVALVRSAMWISGLAIIGLCALFLVFAGGKSSLALCFLVLLLTSLTWLIRSFAGRVIMLLTPLVLLNMLSVGTVMNDGLAAIAKMLHSTPASPGAPTSGHLPCNRCSRNSQPATASRRSGAAARSRVFRKARNGLPSPRTATTAISIPRSAWGCRASRC